METLESDLKRLVQNAKDFNDNRSEVYEDAERIRKALSNFMPKHNPAYLNPEYKAYATPLPDDAPYNRTNGTSTPAAEVSGNTENLKIKLPNTLGRRRQSTAVPSDEDNGPSDEMIAKQVGIIDEMMELPNAEYASHNLWRPLLTSFGQKLLGQASETRVSSVLQADLTSHSSDRHQENGRERSIPELASIH